MLTSRGLHSRVLLASLCPASSRPLLAQRSGVSEWTGPHSVAQGGTWTSNERPCPSRWPPGGSAISGCAAVRGAGVLCDQATAQNLTPHLHGTEPGSLFIPFLRKSCFWWQVRPWPFQCQVVFLSPNPSFSGSFFLLLGGCLCLSLPTPGDPGYCPQPGSRMRREVWLLSLSLWGWNVSSSMCQEVSSGWGPRRGPGVLAPSAEAAQPRDLGQLPALGRGLRVPFCKQKGWERLDPAPGGV